MYFHYLTTFKGSTWENMYIFCFGNNQCTAYIGILYTLFKVKQQFLFSSADTLSQISDEQYMKLSIYIIKQTLMNHTGNGLLYMYTQCIRVMSNPKRSDSIQINRYLMLNIYLFNYI